MSSAALTVTCPSCGSREGMACVTPTPRGPRFIKSYHYVRINLAQTTEQPQEALNA